MCLNCYVTKKLLTGCKSMSTSNYTTEINDAICEEHRQRRKRETGTSGIKNAGTKSKHLRKLPAKQYLCVCVSPLISFYGNGH